MQEHRIHKNLAFLLLVFFLASAASFAQRVKQLNLPNYDHEKLHFGFSLGFNKGNFVVFPQDNANKPDSVWSIASRPELGFNLGIISDLRIHDYMTLRFLPALTFQERILEYKIHTTGATPGSFDLVAKKIESTLLDFPVNLKIRSERLNNVSAYLLAGGKFSIDLASQAKTNDPEVVKLNNKDWTYEAGFGLDFYLEYFKLSVEMKFSAGFKDRLYHEPTTYSASVSRLFTKLWLFSLNFEG